jgi:hypothetical protein
VILGRINFTMTQPLKDRLTEWWARLQLARDAVAVEDQRELLGRDRQLTDDYRRRMLFDQPPAAEADMGDFVLGDQQTIHHHPRPTIGLWPRVLLLAAMLSGCSIPAGLAVWKLPEILRALRSEPAAPSVDDAAMWFDLTVGPPPQESTKSEPRNPKGEAPSRQQRSQLKPQSDVAAMFCLNIDDWSLLGICPL